jgi:hypothetical protein
MHVGRQDQQLAFFRYPLRMYRRNRRKRGFVGFVSRGRGEIPRKRNGSQSPRSLHVTPPPLRLVDVVFAIVFGLCLGVLIGLDL